MKRKDKEILIRIFTTGLDDRNKMEDDKIENLVKRNFQNDERIKEELRTIRDNAYENSAKMKYGAMTENDINEMQEEFTQQIKAIIKKYPAMQSSISDTWDIKGYIKSQANRNLNKTIWDFTNLNGQFAGINDNKYNSYVLNIFNEKKREGIDNKKRSADNISTISNSIYKKAIKLYLDLQEELDPNNENNGSERSDDDISTDLRYLGSNFAYIIELQLKQYLLQEKDLKPREDQNGNIVDPNDYKAINIIKANPDWYKKLLIGRDDEDYKNIIQELSNIGYNNQGDASTFVNYLITNCSLRRFNHNIYDMINELKNINGGREYNEIINHMKQLTGKTEAEILELIENENVNNAYINGRHKSGLPNTVFLAQLSDSVMSVLSKDVEIKAITSNLNAQGNNLNLQSDWSAKCSSTDVGRELKESEYIMYADKIYNDIISYTGDSTQSELATDIALICEYYLKGIANKIRLDNIDIVKKHNLETLINTTLDYIPLQNKLNEISEINVTSDGIGITSDIISNPFHKCRFGDYEGQLESDINELKKFLEVIKDIVKTQTNVRYIANTKHNDGGYSDKIERGIFPAYDSKIYILSDEGMEEVNEPQKPQKTHINLEAGQTIICLIKRDNNYVPKAYYYDEKRQTISEYSEDITNGKLKQMYTHLGGLEDERESEKQQREFVIRKMQLDGEDRRYHAQRKGKFQYDIAFIRDKITELEKEISVENDPETKAKLEAELNELKGKLPKVISQKSPNNLRTPDEDPRWRNQFMITLTAERKKNTQVLQQTQTQAGTGR